MLLFRIIGIVGRDLSRLFGFHEGLSFLPSISLWVHSFSPVVCHKITLSICIAEYMKNAWF